VNSLGKKIKHLMIDKQIKQLSLAKAADVSEAYISDVLADKKPPSLAVIKSIAEKLEVTIDELVKTE